MTPDLNAFDNATSVVTHPGGAHRDDLLAVAVVLGLNPMLAVFRRDPTPGDLENPAVVVIDAGQQYDTEMANFDHHQLPRDAPPTSALTLVMARIGLLEAARAAFPWMTFTELADSKGPTVAAKYLGTSMDRYQATISPIETSVLRMFERVPGTGLWPGDELHNLLRNMGVETVMFMKKFAGRSADLTAKAKILSVSAPGMPTIQAIDASFVDRKDDPTLALEPWVKEHCPAAAVTITQDDRGDGMTVFRRHDDPRVDFSALEGKAGTVFAHKNGFVAKLAPSFDPVTAIQQSLRPAAAATA